VRRSLPAGRRGRAAGPQPGDDRADGADDEYARDDSGSGDARRDDDDDGAGGHTAAGDRPGDDPGDDARAEAHDP
jgi:hypothetical protein